MAGCRPGHGRELGIHALCVLHRSSAAPAVAEGPDDSAARRATQPHRTARARGFSRSGNCREGRSVAPDGAVVACALRETGSRGIVARRTWSRPAVFPGSHQRPTAPHRRWPHGCRRKTGEPSSCGRVPPHESLGFVACVEEGSALASKRPRANCSLLTRPTFNFFLFLRRRREHPDGLAGGIVPRGRCRRETLALKPSDPTHLP